MQVCQHRRYHEGEKCVVIFISAHITLMRQHRACMTHFFSFCCKENSTVEKKKTQHSTFENPQINFLISALFSLRDWIRTLQFYQPPQEYIEAELQAVVFSEAWDRKMSVYMLYFSVFVFLKEGFQSKSITTFLLYQLCILDD